VDGGVVRADGLGSNSECLERRFQWSTSSGSETWFERYVHDGRWIVIRAPERAREVANGLRIDPGDGAPSDRYTLRVTAEVPAGWQIVDRVELIRHETRQRATAESYSVPEGVSDDVWIDQQIASLDGQAGFVRQSRAEASFLGRRAAIAVTYQTPPAANDAPLRTSSHSPAPVEPSILRVWLGVIGRRGYRVIVSLPESDRGLAIMPNHNLLAGHLVLRDYASPLSSLGSMPTINTVRRLFKR
jgi:hypothetical protein